MQLSFDGPLAKRGSMLHEARMSRHVFSLLVIVSLLFTFFFANPMPVQANVANNGLVTPTTEDALQGLVEITGIAQHPTFRKWQLDMLLNNDEKQAAFIAVGEKQQIEPGVLAMVDTTLYPNGHHRLRLRVVHSNLNYDEYFTPITIDNRSGLSPAPAPETPADEPAAAPPDLTVPLGQGLPEGRRWIEIDLSDQTLTAWQGENSVLHTLISSGRTEYPTVRGSYQVRTKLDLELMIGPGYYTPDVPYTMYFFRGYAIHGAYWHNNFGTPVSHGCVNMRVNEAKALYAWTAVGTEVVVHD